MPISSITNSPEVPLQPATLPQTISVAQTPENAATLETAQGVTPDLANQFKCDQTLSEFLKEVFPDISPEELEIYENAGLNVETVGGQVCLPQPEIDLDYKDANGMTNLERMENGLAPINPEDGLPYELHHVGQDNDGPLAELTHSQHMSSETNKTLHPIRSGSDVDHGYSWRDVREEHWKARAEQLKKQYNYGA